MKEQDGTRGILKKIFQKFSKNTIIIKMNILLSSKLKQQKGFITCERFKEIPHATARRAERENMKPKNKKRIPNNSDVHSLGKERSRQGTQNEQAQVFTHHRYHRHHHHRNHRHHEMTKPGAEENQQTKQKNRRDKGEKASVQFRQSAANS